MYGRATAGEGFLLRQDWDQTMRFSWCPRKGAQPQGQNFTIQLIYLQESQDLAFLRLEHSPDLEHKVRPTRNQILFYDVDLPEFAPL